MILHVTHYAFELVSHLKNGNLDELTQIFHAECKKFNAKITPQLFVINKDMLVRAMAKTDYFNKNKLIFFGFNIDPLCDIYATYDQLLRAEAEGLDRAGAFKDLNGNVVSAEVVGVMKKTLKKEFIDLYPRIIHNNNVDSVITQQALELLVEFGFGTIRKNTVGKPCLCNSFLQISSCYRF